MFPGCYFSERIVIQDGCPGLWFAITFFYFFSMTTCTAVTTLARNSPLGVLKKCCYFSLWIEIQYVHPCVCFILRHFSLLQNYCMPNCKSGIGRRPCRFAAVISCYNWLTSYFHMIGSWRSYNIFYNIVVQAMNVFNLFEMNIDIKPLDWSHYWVLKLIL